MFSKLPWLVCETLNLLVIGSKLRGSRIFTSSRLFSSFCHYLLKDAFFVFSQVFRSEALPLCQISQLDKSFTFLFQFSQIGLILTKKVSIISCSTNSKSFKAVYFFYSSIHQNSVLQN